MLRDFEMQPHRKPSFSLHEPATHDDNDDNNNNNNNENDHDNDNGRAKHAVTLLRDFPKDNDRRRKGRSKLSLYAWHSMLLWIRRHKRFTLLGLAFLFVVVMCVTAGHLARRRRHEKHKSFSSSMIIRSGS